MSTTDEELSVLEVLAADPSASQRHVARRVGLSLAKTHAVVRRLVANGWVVVDEHAEASPHKLGYAYRVTEEGRRAKARLLYDALGRQAGAFQLMTTRLDALLDQAIGSDGREVAAPKVVAVVGSGPLAEVLRQRVAVRRDAVVGVDPASADLAVLADPSADRDAASAATVVLLS